MSVTGSRVSNANDLPRTRVFAMPDFRFPDRSSDRRAEAAAPFVLLNARMTSIEKGESV
ncbi:hypothetical protein PQR71_11945 [Paraburkholderia fungorum]|uniref:hypothetical protein n=1 Tax=Paraburkholderia fungorum TaxID=134537 RepID=UPI0038BB966E